jgi:hypothetical protein
LIKKGTRTKNWFPPTIKVPLYTPPLTRKTPPYTPPLTRGAGGVKRE